MVLQQAIEVARQALLREGVEHCRFPAAGHFHVEFQPGVAIGRVAVVIGSTIAKAAVVKHMHVSCKILNISKVQAQVAALVTAILQ